jgi:hypothetical protein
MICGCALYFGLQAPAEALLFLLPLGFGMVECDREQLEGCRCELNPGRGHPVILPVRRINRLLRPKSVCRISL